MAATGFIFHGSSREKSPASPSPPRSGRGRGEVSNFQLPFASPYMTTDLILEAGRTEKNYWQPALYFTGQAEKNHQRHPLRLDRGEGGVRCRISNSLLHPLT